MPEKGKVETKGIRTNVQKTDKRAVELGKTVKQSPGNSIKKPKK